MVLALAAAVVAPVAVLDRRSGVRMMVSPVAVLSIQKFTEGGNGT
jgi:hypothetical protein